MGQVLCKDHEGTVRLLFELAVGDEHLWVAWGISGGEEACSNLAGQARINPAGCSIRIDERVRPQRPSGDPICDRKRSHPACHKVPGCAVWLGGSVATAALGDRSR
jgi:hypothetical protein